ncbi:MAG: hypothetical protein CMN05_01855 [Roseibacillus sp.]|jgi:hypothetical protein|nr:hypothetical protein [Roseibacillus sp.]MCP4731853.1 hypothetical protein [Roseibacillus sp.]MDP7309426.1 hypothetical protein [Roseibacillus sp.]MDP7495113.1 hypothetical protein [Roseibacillus sp.]MDP7656223.1 hypothetical protein [Roseibacillus sp.]|tara:strand:- start:14392 stop:14760 length:369 start_codon:yes stop_codon:yes gene_type:complete
MKIISLIACALMLALSSAFAGPVNKNCPVSGKEVDGSKCVKYTVPFCCEKCVAKYEKDPASHLAAVAEGEKGKCIFSGKDCKAVVNIQIAVCCAKCEKKVKAAPQKCIAKIAKTKKSEKKGS